VPQTFDAAVFQLGLRLGLELKVNLVIFARVSSMLSDVRMLSGWSDAFHGIESR